MNFRGVIVDINARGIYVMVSRGGQQVQYGPLPYLQLANGGMYTRGDTVLVMQFGSLVDDMAVAGILVDPLKNK